MIKKIDLSNFRMPAEWENQDSTLIAWPHNKDDWPGYFENIPKVFAQIIAGISKAQKVKLLIQTKKNKLKIFKLIKKFNGKINNIKIIIKKTDRVWTRDSGPIFIINKNKDKKIVLDWKFNAWAKYPNFKNDNLITQKIYNKQNILKPLFKNNQIVLEGGSIDVNGNGLLLTTKECLLSKVQQRNPKINKINLEKIFNKYLGIKKTIWLNKGILGDDTHGHIDDIARFVSPNTVFLANEKNKKDENFKILNENLKILKKTKKILKKIFSLKNISFTNMICFTYYSISFHHINYSCCSIVSNLKFSL